MQQGTKIMSVDVKKLKVGCGHLWYHLHENWCSKSLQNMEDCPSCPEFNVGQANLLEKYDFMAFVMKHVRCTTKWGDLEKWQEKNGRLATVDERTERSAPALCFQLVEIIILIANELGMNSNYVHFVSEEISHWGVDVELENNNWAFYDPTYFFCAKDPLPLDSKQIQNRPDLLNVWDQNFSQISSVANSNRQRIDGEALSKRWMPMPSLCLIFKECSIEYLGKGDVPSWSVQCNPKIQ